MSRRHVEELVNVYQHLFEDASMTFPELAGEFEKDFSRLLRLLRERGLQLITVDLPNVGKVLDTCLDIGQYIRSGLPLTKRVSNRVAVPKFLRGLYLLVFHEDGRLRDDCNVEAVLFLRQFLYVGKKVKLDCSTHKTLATVREFVSVDQSLPEPEEVWDEECPTESDFDIYSGFSHSRLYNSRIDGSCGDSKLPWSPQLSTVLAALDFVSGAVASTLGGYCYRDYGFRHGPGAIAETTGPTNKYCWRSWSNRLENAFPIADCGYHNYASWASNAMIDFEEDSDEEPKSRLIAVPKTQKGPRLIAAEPSAHQWCQQNIWHYFCTRVQNTWIGDYIRFRDQSLNQELCKLGSRDGGLITVDLSAASDRVTPHFVGQLFRSNRPLLLALQACRTRRMEQQIDYNSPSELQLRKFSTMGSSVTFPVQSIGFLCISLAATIVSQGLPLNARTFDRLRGSVAVFGDDIIVPKVSRALLYEILELLDFRVNTDKSFMGDYFRESCGVDSFMGVDVTPTYWKSPCSRGPESIASTVEVRNNFHNKFFLSTAAYIASTIPWEFPMVPMDSGAVGLKSFATPPPSVVKTRWNEELQRMEACVPVFTTRQRKTPTNDDSAILQYFTEKPDPYQQWESGFSQRPKTSIRLRWVPFQDLSLLTEPVKDECGACRD